MVSTDTFVSGAPRKSKLRILEQGIRCEALFVQSAVREAGMAEGMVRQKTAADFTFRCIFDSNRSHSSAVPGANQDLGFDTKVLPIPWSNCFVFALLILSIHRHPPVSWFVNKKTKMCPSFVAFGLGRKGFAMRFRSWAEAMLLGAPLYGGVTASAQHSAPVAPAPYPV
jgi:hypothetical protein